MLLAGSEFDSFAYDGRSSLATSCPRFGRSDIFCHLHSGNGGLLLVLARRWRDPWWRFVLYGLAVSIVPGAITDWPFHELRLMAYAVFLVVLTVPALEWLLATR